MDQFEEMKGALPCAMCEAMCPEAVDGTLTAAEQAAFDTHVAGCVSCAHELAEAHRGAAWMQMLKGQAPEPPAALLQRILAETSGVAAESFAVPPARQETPQEWVAQGIAEEMQPTFAPAKQSWWTGFSARMSETFSLRQMSFSPRLAMTAAMAFFSIALSLNMAGVRVTDLRWSMLKPSSIQRTVADASASATRSFQNLRVVYEFESRMSDMRNSGELGNQYEDQRQDSGVPFTGSQQQSAPNNNQQQQEQKQEQPKPQGKSSLEFPLKPNEIAEKGA